MSSAARAISLLALLLLAASCQAGPARLTREAGPSAPADIVSACRLADQRCDRCHPIERVLNARVQSFEQWQAVVHRMRLQPGSAIALGEEPALAYCLTYVTLGAEAAEKSKPRSAP